MDLTTWIMARHASTLALLLVLPVLLWPASAGANPQSAVLRARAYALAYSLDYDEATRVMEAAVKADPQDVAAERGLAVIPWLLISFSRGTATVDDYLGPVSKQSVALRSPPADLATRFTRHIARALMLSEAAVGARPRDAEAQYQLGATIGLQASYIATVEGKILGAFRGARRAYDAHETVLELAPGRNDAGLTVGMYRYLVGAMSLPIRMLAYAAGFGGDQGRGMRLIEEAATYAGDGQADAQFALVLLYNREGRHGDALTMLAELQRVHPRNRMLWLEAGATALRGGRADEAERHLVEGMRRLQADMRPRMFGEEALWYQKRGATRVALNRLPDAEADLRKALASESRKWVTGRAHAELGKIDDLRGRRASAKGHFEQAVKLGTDDNDPIGVDAAQRYVGTAFKR